MGHWLSILLNQKDGTMEIIEQGDPARLITGLKDIHAAGSWVRARGGGMGAIKMGRPSIGRYREAWVPALDPIAEAIERTR